MIPVKVEKISYHPSSRSYAVLLKDERSDLFLPILVGSFEAQSIALAIEVVDTPRPLTHDLICDLITKVDGKLLAVNISKLNDGVFYASLKLSGDNFGTKTIDARPSDAISIALRLNAQIYVTAEVIEEAGVGEDEVISDKQNILPKYSVEDLEIKLKKAVEEEEYEKAARIRDKLKDLESS
ncbi:bifunctional nuclease family protein [bacterium]|jgi:bifunctional DNase/RNase|nr:bifunctional nuclease family protein [bacterium]MBT4250637.1 bifunctional nuclease family protein [bacterium]MBT4926753.1 bifunctional nuclease family protein [bacterium]MBT5734850.1 bifunctional nuclease family protein [bacterium]MBT6019090.1 bifunctional nuclease family protein [bacterium]